MKSRFSTYEYRYEQVFCGHVAHLGDHPVRPHPRVHGVGVEHLHPCGDALEDLLGDGCGVVVDEQVGSKGRKLLFSGLRRGDPHLDAWTVALDRERYGLAVHPRGDTHEYAHIVLLLSKTSYTHCTSPVPRKTHANFVELRLAELRRTHLSARIRVIGTNNRTSEPQQVFWRS